MELENIFNRLKQIKKKIKRDVVVTFGVSSISNNELIFIVEISYRDLIYKINFTEESILNGYCDSCIDGVCSKFDMEATVKEVEYFSKNPIDI